MRQLLLLLSLCLPVSVQAGEIIHAEVEFRDGRYFVEVESIVKARANIVYDLLTDYNNLTLINPDIKSSRLVYSLDKNTHRTHVIAESCISFFCQKINLEQDVEELDNGVIVTTVDADKSDFIYGHARWKITEEFHQTRIHYSNDLKPKFFIPPLIGPILIKDKLREEVLATIKGLENLAASVRQ